MTERKNLKKIRLVLGTLIICVIAAICLGAEYRVYAAKSESANEPTASWTEDEWSDYRAMVKAALPKGKLAIYVSLDDKPSSGLKFYQSSGSYSEKIDEYGTKMNELSGFPGIFLFDEKEMSEKRCVFVYYEDETNGYNHLCSEWFYESDFDNDSFGRIKLYTVSFEQGDIKCRSLPKTIIQNSKYGIEVESDTKFGREPGYKLDGYYFCGWEDKGGNAVYEVNSPVTLHPAYVTELEAAEDGATGNGYYMGIDGSRGEFVNVSTVDQFRNTLLDEKATYVKLTKDIELTAKTKGNPSYMYPEGREGVFSVNGDVIVVQKGVTFTIDGATLSSQYGYGERGKIIVQNGATLKIQNGELRYFSIVVMPGGTFLVDGSYVEYEGLHNYGTIKISNAFDITGRCSVKGSEQLLFQYNGGNGNFFNAEGATITIEDNAQFQVYGNTYSEYENVNRGIITLNDDGRFIVKGDSSDQNQDRREVTPFVNEGTINICCTPGTDDKYYDGRMLIEDAKLLNKGTINVAPAASKWTDEYTSESAKNVFIDVNGSFLINEGTISMDLKDSYGIKVDDLYIKKDSYCAPCDYDIKSCFENRKGGVIKAELAKGAHAIFIEEDSELNNYGTITLNGKTNTPRDASLIVSGTVLNKGTLKGSGSIAYYSNGTANSISYKGNKTKLKVKYAYKISIIDKKTDCTLYQGSKKTVDKEVYSCKPYDNNVYYLSAGSHKITVELDGYKKYTGTFKTVKNLNAYLELAYVPNFDVKPTQSGKKSVKSVELEESVLTYNYGYTYANVIAKDGKGNLIYDDCYTLEYPSDSGTIGEHKLTVKFSNGFSGTKTLKYTVVPLGTKITYVTGASKSLKVEFAEQTTETSFYEVQACKDLKFESGVKSAKTKNNTTTAITVKGLNSNTAYYVRVRTAKKVGKKTYYSEWNTVKIPIKTK